MDDQLKLEYIPLSQARRWSENPKLHDLDRLIKSIERNGFGDPPKFDAKLDALVYGNGRAEALERMRREGRQPPRGILQFENGEWALPVIFGVDSESKSKAVAFAIDHNNLTMLGGDFEFTDLLRMWDEPGLQAVLADTPDAGDLLASFDSVDVESLLAGPDFEPVAPEEQSRLDEKKPISCPACGHEFHR